MYVMYTTVVIFITCTRTVVVCGMYRGVRVEYILIREKGKTSVEIRQMAETGV